MQSNYASWNFSAGIGPGKVYNFNSIKQSRDYDSKGKFIKMWCPEIETVPVAYVHEPWRMPADLSQQLKIEIGVTYPKPI